MAQRPQVKIEAGHWDVQAQVQGIANSIADMLAETIGKQDPVLLAMLHRELRIVRSLCMS